MLMQSAPRSSNFNLIHIFPLLFPSFIIRSEMNFVCLGISAWSAQTFICLLLDLPCHPENAWYLKCRETSRLAVAGVPDLSHLG